MPFAFRIVTGSSVPIYRQLVDQVSVAVAAGELAPGERLPSVRAVAEALLVNPNTVARAYAELTQAGVIDAQPGRGLYVAPRRQRLADGERAERLGRAVEQFATAVALLGYTRGELLEQVESALAALEPAPRSAGSAGDESGGYAPLGAGREARS